MAQKPQNQAMQDGVAVGYFAVDRLACQITALLTTTTWTMQKAQTHWKKVCLASSRVCISRRRDRKPSTRAPPKLRLKTSRAARPRCTALEISTSSRPVREEPTASWICRMASAEERWTSRISSGRSPSSPVALLPTARWQNQHEWSLILCWPTSVSIRCMCPILNSRSSIADAKGAVSSRILRTSVMAWPSTSSSCLSSFMRWMPSSTPRKTGASFEPFSASSDMVSSWQSMLAMASLTWSDIV
mmetsp:Transcript_62832/g.202667  ORF Transcript_62832/g.202667 Transcript_62832/m.202667 type:complete len:245 (+) Transcript_62832:1209-1943(+)